MMKLKIDGALPPLKFVPPRLNRFVLRLVSAVAPLYIKKSLGLHILPPQQPEKLIREYQDFFDGKSRLILVFRHVHVHDAQVIFYLLNNILPKESRRLKMPLPRHPHAHFLYGRGVPVWAGRWLEWLFSRVGGIPVFHRRLDREGLDEVRSHLLHGAYPIALAPEGQVTYHNGVVHEIEPGFAHLALWAQQDLQKQGLSKDVRVLPISQYYRYGRDGEKSLQEVLEKLEAEVGLERDESAELPARLGRAGAALFSRIEGFYRKNYGIEAFSESESGAGGGIRPDECSRRRTKRLVEAVLQLQEQRLGITHPPHGFTPRIFTIRQAGWDRIFQTEKEQQEELRESAAERRDAADAVNSRHGQSGGDGLHDDRQDSPGRTYRQKSPLDDSLNDYLAVEAALFARHLEVVDLLAYLQPEYALESEDTNRQVELALNLLDAVNRLEGGSIGQRLHIKPCEVKIAVGQPISLQEIIREEGLHSLRQTRESLVERLAGQFEELSL